jgi:hypothetical protein
VELWNGIFFHAEKKWRGRRGGERVRTERRPTYPSEEDKAHKHTVSVM